MDDSGPGWGDGGFKSQLNRWRSLGPGATNPDGSPLRKPPELAEAELVLDLCERFHCLPSQLMGESAGIIRLIMIESEGRYREDGQ
jgi:hypothetical protein